jgi:hypothetical protein
MNRRKRGESMFWKDRTGHEKALIILAVFVLMMAMCGKAASAAMLQSV